MAQRVVIPRMGQTMTEGLVAKWCKADGDGVKPGDDIYELEYDKATSVVQARAEGIIKLLYEEGAVVPLGEAVAVILEDGEEFDASMAKGAYSVANAAQGGAPEGKEQELAPLAAIHGAGRDEGDDESIRISPHARKIAKEHGIDIRDIVPKDGKRITKDDVLSFVQQPAGQREGPPLEARREPMKGMRKAIADNMTKSYFTYPAVTLTTDADMGALLKMREQWNEEFASDGAKITVTDMLVKAVAKALLEHGIVNTSLEGDEVVYHDEVNISIAVALAEGLVVPVVRHADKLSLNGIADETKRLVELAGSGRLGAEDMNGGTFTITNLGTFGIDAFNPIINYPQSAILGVGRTVKKPAVEDDKIVIQQRAMLSFTHDHRVIDGAPGALFLQSVVRYIEKPFLLLTD